MFYVFTFWKMCLWTRPHSFWQVPSPDGWIFIATVLFQQTKMKCDVAGNPSAGSIIHSAPLTKFGVTGCCQVRPGVFKKNTSTQQSTLMALEDGRGTLVGMEDGSGAAVS
jgi:hypothetical protein